VIRAHAPKPATAPTAPARARGEAERSSLTRRAGIVAAGTFVSRLLGLAREMVLAALFRRSETDAFFVAFTIPSTLRQLLGEGAVASAVVPVLTETREQRGEEAGRQLFRAVRGASLALLVIATVLGVVLAPALCELFAPGFHAEPGQFERTVLLTRVTFPCLLFMGTAALGMAALSSARRFAVAAFSPALVNVGMIAVAVLAPAALAARGLDPALAMALGALCGGAFHMLAQWPALRRLGYLRPPRIDLGHPGVRAMGRRLLPMALGTGVFFLNMALARRFLSDLGEGAQSYFTWAMRLCDLPQGVFVVAIATASLPSLASLAAAGERGEVARTYALGMRLALFVALPASTLLVVLAHPLVVVCFQRGEFGAEAAKQTALALGAQACGLWAVAASRQLVPTFYAHGNTRVPTAAALVNLGVFVALAWGLRASLGHAGVGLGFSAGNVAQMAVLWILLRRELPSLRLREIGASAARTTLCCAAGAVAGWALVRALGPMSEATGSPRMLPGVTGVAAFAAAFVLLAVVLRSPELGLLARALRRDRRASLRS
jgi:putative peptidoglycan lipid II flippase